jgi:hypothetical protein
VQHHQPRAQLLHEVQQVRREHHGGAGGGVRGDGGLHAAHAERVEPGERLVEEEDARVVEERAGDGQLLPHPARELAGEGAALLRELQLREQRRDARGRVAHPVEAGHELQVLLDGQVVEEVRLVGDEGELALGRDGVGGEVHAGHAHAPRRGDEDAGAAAERGGLAGAVGPDQPDDLPRVDRERDAAHGEGAVVALAQRADVEQRRGGGRRGGRARVGHAANEAPRPGGRAGRGARAPRRPRRPPVRTQRLGEPHPHRRAARHAALLVRLPAAHRRARGRAAGRADDRPRAPRPPSTRPRMAPAMAPLTAPLPGGAGLVHHLAPLHSPVTGLASATTGTKSPSTLTPRTMNSAAGGSPRRG